MRKLRRGGVSFGRGTIARRGMVERTAHTWFGLHGLPGQESVKDYDEPWTGYGSGHRPGQPRCC